MVYRQRPHGMHTDLEDRDAQLSQSLFADDLAPLAPHLALESKQPVPSCIGFGSLWWVSELESALLCPKSSCPFQPWQDEHSTEGTRQKGRGVPGIKYLAAKPLCFSIEQKIFSFVLFDCLCL